MKLIKKWKDSWYIVLIFALALAQVIMFTAWGDHSFVAIHDNLDLFVAHNKIMKNQGIFFAQGAEAEMLGGVSRDTLGSEFSLYNILYFLFSPYTAYVLGYFLKLVIGFSSFLLLIKDIYGEKYEEYKGIAWLTAAGFAMVPVFSAYGIAFVSVPLVIYLLRKIYHEQKVIWHALLFLYPLISYFSYFGFFILAYLVCGIGFFWIRDKKFPKPLGIALIVLALGYMSWEYRLFREMLFGDTVTIRSSMVIADVSFAGIFGQMWEALLNPIFHAQSSHKYWILPICVMVLIISNIGYIKKKDFKGMAKEPVNLVFLLILFNCFIYGLYHFRPFRNLFEMIVPPLKGFQFNRTVFFNPFLWYALFFLVLKWLWEHIDRMRLKQLVIYGMAAAGTFVCMLAPQVYNDFCSNLYHHAYEILKGTPSTQLSFGEFYSEELFEKIKEDIGYEGEWAAAYGMHPAVLQFNGIATLDGYLGLYSQEYKEQFGRLIEPALEGSEEFRNTFLNSGIRAYLYSGAGENTYQPLKELNIADTKLYINGEVFREMNGTYIFSRIAISNAEELGLELIGEYTHETSPYTIYVYGNKM